MSVHTTLDDSEAKKKKKGQKVGNNLAFVKKEIFLTDQKYRMVSINELLQIEVRANPVKRQLNEDYIGINSKVQTLFWLDYKKGLRHGFVKVYKNKYSEWLLKYVGDAPKRIEFIKNLQKTKNVRKIKGKVVDLRPRKINQDQKRALKNLIQSFQNPESANKPGFHTHKNGIHSGHIHKNTPFSNEIIQNASETPN